MKTLMHTNKHINENKYKMSYRLWKTSYLSSLRNDIWAENNLFKVNLTTERKKKKKKSKTRDP